MRKRSSLRKIICVIALNPGGGHSQHDWLRTRVQKKRRKGIIFSYQASSTFSLIRGVFQALIAQNLKKGTFLGSQFSTFFLKRVLFQVPIFRRFSRKKRVWNSVWFRVRPLTTPSRRADTHIYTYRSCDLLMYRLLWCMHGRLPGDQVRRISNSRNLWESEG